MPLTGKTILITRAASQAGEMSELIRNRGGKPLLFPTIEITPPPNWESCDRAIDRLSMYDGILFTSANAADFFLRRISERGCRIGELNGKILCAVGRSTKDRLEAEGLSVSVMPPKFTAVDLGRALRQEDLRGKSFLFPCGNLAGDDLPGMLRELGAAVDAVVVYGTAPPPQGDIDKIRTLLLQGSIDVLTFTSPSTWNNFIVLFPDSEAQAAIRSGTIAAIGPTTARSVEASGFTVTLVPVESSLQAFVESIETFFRTSNHAQ